METTTSGQRLVLLALCAPALHGGFLAFSEPETARHLFQGGGSVLLAVLNAAAAAAVVLLEGKARRWGAWWLALMLGLGGLLAYPFWRHHGPELSTALQSLLSVLGFAAAFVMVPLWLGRRAA